MSQKTTVLLTGFGPFPGVPVNATVELVPRIARRARRTWPGLSVRTAILPTEWVAGPQRSEAAISRHRPDIVIHFGVSSQAMGFVIERIGTNERRSYPDAAGELPGAGEGRSLRHASRLPWKAIVARLKALGLPAEPSDDAGAYLCNAVLYSTLCHPARPPVAGFVHIPAALAAQDGPLTMEGAIAGALGIVEVCLTELRMQGSVTA